MALKPKKVWLACKYTYSDALYENNFWCNSENIVRGYFSIDLI